LRIEPPGAHADNGLSRVQLGPGQTHCEDNSMQNFRIVAIETEIAEQVRATLKTPVYAFAALISGQQ